MFGLFDGMAQGASAPGLGMAQAQNPGLFGDANNFIADNRMSLLNFGLGLMSGQSNSEAFRGGMAGLAAGRSADDQTRQRRALTQVLQQDSSIPANLRPLLAQMDPKTALEWYTSERNYNRTLDTPQVIDDGAGGRRIVTPRMMMGAIGGGGGSPSVSAPMPSGPPQPGGAVQPAQPPQVGMNPASIGVPIGGDPAGRQGVEARQREVIADRLGLQGDARTKYIATGNWDRAIPEGYRSNGRGGLEPVPGGPADQAPSGFRWNDPSAPRDQRQLQPVEGGPATQLPGDQAGRVGLSAQWLREAPQLRQKIESGVFEGPLTRSGMAAGEATGDASRGTFGQTNIAFRGIQSGVDVLLRNLTGAGMNLVEAQQYARRYLPSAGDSRAVILDKFDRLQREIAATSNAQAQGRGGLPGGAPSGGRPDPLGIR